DPHPFVPFAPVLNFPVSPNRPVRVLLSQMSQCFVGQILGSPDLADSRLFVPLVPHCFRLNFSISADPASSRTSRTLVPNCAHSA
ncbi:hypothetical protein KI387_029462, partial [Taxus chinensis]